MLIELQNHIVDPRFHDHDFRNNQNYVGENVIGQPQKIHYISPQPSDLHDLMEGLFVSHNRMNLSSIHPVIHAAIIAYGFVFMHPFEDGNGRIHRFLIHNILSRRGFTPPGGIFPVSAVMLKKMTAYDASLEAFSKPLMELIDFDLDDEGRLTVQNQTTNFYRFIDFTIQAEALFEFIVETIDVEWVQELQFLANYDKTKRAIQEIIDMPDRLIDLFIKLCLQNHGKLSAAKRQSHFSMLTDLEVSKMERAIQTGYQAEPT
jgi:hypothetical protein